MWVVEVQFTPWEKAYWFDPAGLNLCSGDKVIVSTELGIEMGEVVRVKEVAEGELGGRELKKVFRRANLSDFEKLQSKQGHQKEAMRICREIIKKRGLSMKLVDVHFSFDGGRITFAFTADGRIDFRDLVKDLTHHFQKSIRLHQLGVRDEAKMVGEFGPCGMKLCCKKFLNNLGQVTAELVDLQQVAHRGSDRLSGPCGRLKCCLRYENELYEELAKNLPEIGRKVKTDHGRGEIIERNILKQSVRVKLEDEDGTIVEIPIKGKD